MIGLRHCGQKTIVIDTRHYKHHTGRRRECVVCRERFTTKEVYVPDEFVPLAANGKVILDDKDQDAFELWIDVITETIPPDIVSIVHLAELRRWFRAGMRLERALEIIRNRPNLPDPPPRVHVLRPRQPPKKRIFIRRCKDCRVELTEANLAKKADRICRDCKEARNGKKNERWNARMGSDFRIKVKERIPFMPPVGKEELAKLYQEYNLIELGAKFNRSAETIRNWLKHYGINRRPHGSHIVHIRKHAQMVAMCESGVSPEEIAVAFGYTAETICHHLGIASKRDGRKREPIPPNCPRCLTKPRARGLCNDCYHLWLRQGKPEGIKTRQPKPIGCEDCKTRPFCKGLCRNCYGRQRYRGLHIQDTPVAYSAEE